MVSVVIPTHNRVDLLPRAIESVLNQTYKDIEIIVVSDGSTDGTDELMDKYKSDSRINYISYYPEKGGNYARNTGVKEAKGEYVAFLDDDDQWLPNKIEKQLEVMKSDEKIGLVYTGLNVIYADDDITYQSIPSEQGDLSKSILMKSSIGSTSTILVKKDIIVSVGLFDEELPAVQDYDLFIRIAQKCHVGAVKECMVNYFNYGYSNQISSSTSKYERAYSYIYEKYSNLFASLTPEEMKRRYAYEKISLGQRAMRNGNSKEARSYFLKSWSYVWSPKILLYLTLTVFKFKNILRIRKFMGNVKRDFC